MDEFSGGMDCRFRFSMKDSIMMCILHSAMDKAHEKLKSKEGVIQRLIEISKFYEFAIMQLEGCLKFVREETDSCTLERRHEEVLSDVTKLKDRLRGRLVETEITILNKDRELTERLENEMKLRQALDLKDRELVSLRAKLDLERTKSEEGFQEFNLSNRVSGEEGREGEICELKNAVEQQVWNLKQKLEDGRINLTSGMRNVKPDYELVDEERNWNKKIEHIDNLKETLDLAFRKMQNAIFLSEVEPTEQQWRWTIEKDTISILTKGFTRDLSEHWSDLMKEMTSLRCELENLGCKISRERECSSIRRDKEEDDSKRRIQEFIVRLDNLLNWNAKPGETFGDHRGVHEEENQLADFCEKVDNVLVSSRAIDEELHDEIVKIKQENEDSTLQFMILEETYVILFKGLMENFYIELYNFDTENLIREGIYKDFFREMVDECKNIENYKIEVQIREEIYCIVFSEAVKDLGSTHHGEENLILKLDSLLKCFEVEEDLMLSASSEIKEREELGEEAIFEEFLNEEESTFSSVSSKLEKAFQQLVMSKTLLSELGSSLGVAVGDLEKVHDQRTPIMELSTTSVSVFSPLMGFPQPFADFECAVHHKLGLNMLRLEEVKHQLEPLVDLAASLRKKEELYRKAFIRRCHNLHKAETEVDLLGDQVDVLLGLLERIYMTLHHYSPVLQQYFGVSDILKLIKKELTVGAARS